MEYITITQEILKIQMNNILSKTSDKKILVYGDVIHDHYIYGSSDRLSPEAPVPIVNSKKEENKLGGAANVLQNLISLDAQCDLVTVVGNDSSGMYVVKEIDRRLKYVVFEAEKKTPKKTRIIANRQQLLRIDDETTTSIMDQTQVDVLNFFRQNLKDYSILVLSDYGKGVFANLKDSFLQEIIKIANDNHVVTLIDPHNGTFESNFISYRNATCIKANKKQAEKLSNMKITDNIELVAQHLINLFNLEYVLITLSSDGLFVKEKNKKGKLFPVINQEVSDVTGAGDSVIAALAMALTLTNDVEKCCEIANAAGNVKVKHAGTYAVTRSDILSLVTARDHDTF